MVKLTLVQSGVRGNSNLAHRASASEGESAKRLLEAQGYSVRGPKNKQYESRCPFHEGEGQIGKSVYFYVDSESSQYYCQNAGCGERGNLRTLEKFFGIDLGEDGDAWAEVYKSKETQLQEFEANLKGDLRKPFYDHGLTDATIERFRLGFQPAHYEDVTGEDGKQTRVHIGDRYVIPYLDGRRPRLFRYYSPNGPAKYKYMWEPGSEATLFNGQDAFGDKDGVVFICEGEQKAMLLVQMGYAAVAVPGAGQWRQEWQGAFTHAKKIIVLFDNDNPIHHIYDKPAEGKRCVKCQGDGLDRCKGHNPGQDAAEQRVKQLGWRAKNVLLPLPKPDERKVDVNDYFMRDGHTGAEFAQLALGKNATPFKIKTLAEISAEPPEEAMFLVEQGILPKGGRLLIAGKPKVGKSIFADNLALSLAAGIPFLGRFKVDSGDIKRPGVRTLLLDRELSKRSLYDRMHALMDGRPGYRAAMENLLIDHDHLLRLDQDGGYDLLMNLVEGNGAEVVVLDTAYKFLTDVENAKNLMKAFEVLDRVIHKTGVAVVMTHHLKKGQGGRGKENTDIADPDGVAGSFLWTGWPNATVLLNYAQRSVENPYNSVCTFTAFRDAAAPEPLALFRDRTTISYTAIQDYSHDEDNYAGAKREFKKPTTESVQDLLLELNPITEEEFLHLASVHFGASAGTIRPYFLDAMTSGYFERTSGRPPVIRYKDETPPVESWEAEHGLPEKPVPDTVLDEDMFEAAGLMA